MEIPNEDHLFDIRVVDRHISKGLTTRKDHEKFLASLPDLAEQAELVDVALGTGEKKIGEPGGDAPAESGAGTADEGAGAGAES